MSNQEKNSEIDDLYFILYGERQTKEGQALERLSAVAFKLLEEERRVQYDQQVRAKYSETVYQVDGLLGDDADQVMVEAKDYTVRGEKVGRADLQKLEGALTDLDISEGRFVSATDYTNRAKPYAKSTETNPKQNPITLYHVRPSTPEDEKGRLKTILVTLIAQELVLDKGEYIPIINKQFYDNNKDKLVTSDKRGSTRLSEFFDAEGNVVETIENITYQLNFILPEQFEKDYVLKGKWEFEKSTFIDLGSLGRVQIDALQYKVPTEYYECSFSIDQKGTPVLLIKSEDGSVNKLFTDQQLKQFKFENGEVKKC